MNNCAKCGIKGVIALGLNFTDVRTHYETIIVEQKQPRYYTWLIYYYVISFYLVRNQPWHFDYCDGQK